MKHILTNQWERNKKIIYIMAGCILLMFLLLIIIFVLTNSNQEDVVNLLEYNQLSGSTLAISLLSMVLLLSVCVFTGSFIIFFLKLLFPNTKAFSSLFMPKEREFLKDLPQRIKREVLRDE